MKSCAFCHATFKTFLVDCNKQCSLCTYTLLSVLMRIYFAVNITIIRFLKGVLIKKGLFTLVFFVWDVCEAVGSQRSCSTSLLPGRVTTLNITIHG